MNHDVLKATVRRILEEPFTYTSGVQWTLQGLGMLRLKLSPTVRLHVWDQEEHSVGATPLHTHPWDFRSVVVAGVVHQFRYAQASDMGCPLYLAKTVLCGPGGGDTGGPGAQVRLARHPEETYREGETYEQRAEEIHESLPEPGTVTIIERRPSRDPEHATVYVPYGQEFVSAVPRLATHEEIYNITRKALSNWYR